MDFSSQSIETLFSFLLCNCEIRKICVSYLPFLQWHAAIYIHVGNLYTIDVISSFYATLLKTFHLSILLMPFHLSMLHY